MSPPRLFPIKFGWRTIWRKKNKKEYLKLIKVSLSDVQLRRWYLYRRDVRDSWKVAQALKSNRFSLVQAFGMNKIYFVRYANIGTNDDDYWFPIKGASDIYEL